MDPAELLAEWQNHVSRDGDHLLDWWIDQAHVAELRERWVARAAAASLRTRIAKQKVRKVQRALA